MLGLWTLAQAGVMFANGLAVLNNERFLEKIGWGYSQLHGGNGIGPSPGAFKQQTIGLLHAMTYMRLPLIVVNVLLVFIKLLFG
ncbi:hypothetical protein WJX81_000724 [Elliptochloris bilobata]|uniref:Yos1-like protein n=1 Tax=Elliptochloris bilobata TaxID=381761 RepID=A0AAW1R9R6_9CHLO